MITIAMQRGSERTSRLFGDEKKLLLMAIKRRVAQSSSELKDKFRLRTQASGLGSQIGNAWRANVYPGGSGSANERLAYSPSGFVFSRATNIFMTHITGATILPRIKKFLVLPVKEVQDQWRNRGFTRRDGTQGQARGNARNAGQYAAITMQEWARRNGATLRVIWNEKSGKIAGWAVSNADNKVKFLLMRNVTLRSRLEVNSAFREVSASFPRRMQAEVRRVLDDLNNR